MKNIVKYIILIGALSLSLSSCEDFLNKEPISQQSPNLFWKNDDDIRAAQSAMYSSLATTLSQMYYDWGETRGCLYDPFMSSASVEELMSHDMPDNNGATNWTNLYRTINRAGLVIKYVSEMSAGSASVKNNAIGQAYAMRALCYFYAVRVWGPVPLFTEAVESYDPAEHLKTRSTEAKVIDFIKSDLENAKKYLPEIAGSLDRNYLNMGEVYALEMEVAAWEHDYAKAVSIYENNILKLSSVYAFTEFTPDVSTDDKLSESQEKWRNTVRDDGGEKEIFFAVRYDYSGDGTENSSLNWIARSGERLCIPNSKVLGTGKYESVGPLFEDGDIRCQGTLNLIGGERDETRVIKFWPSGTDYDKIRSENDYIINRYSDLVLLYAEALNETGKTSQAVAQVNRIRTRANIPALSTSLTKDAAASAILKERKLELIGEGKYWFDLVRTGNYSQAKCLDYPACTADKVLFKIHRDHIAQNPNLKNNPE